MMTHIYYSEDRRADSAVHQIYDDFEVQQIIKNPGLSSTAHKYEPNKPINDKLHWHVLPHFTVTS